MCTRSLQLLTTDMEINMYHLLQSRQSTNSKCDRPTLKSSRTVLNRRSSFTFHSFFSWTRIDAAITSCWMWDKSALSNPYFKRTRTNFVTHFTQRVVVVYSNLNFLSINNFCPKQSWRSTMGPKNENLFRLTWVKSDARKDLVSFIPNRYKKNEQLRQLQPFLLSLLTLLIRHQLKHFSVSSTVAHPCGIWHRVTCHPYSAISVTSQPGPWICGTPTSGSGGGNGNGNEHQNQKLKRTYLLRHPLWNK